MGGRICGPDTAGKTCCRMQVGRLPQGGMSVLRLFARPCLTVLLLFGMLLLVTERIPARAPAKAALATENLTYDHVHFGVPDPAKAVEWYAKYMGGQPGPADEPKDRLLFGKTRFIFLKTDNPKPSEGSAIDHIGI